MPERRSYNPFYDNISDPIVTLDDGMSYYGKDAIECVTQLAILNGCYQDLVTFWSFGRRETTFSERFTPIAWVSIRGNIKTRAQGEDAA